MKIALITKLRKLNYDFVAYTKSYTEIDNVLSNQAGLRKLYKEAHNAVGAKCPKEKELLLSDFNLQIIASYMDDTEAEKKHIAEKWNWPVYFVTAADDPDLTKCWDDSCFKCSKCLRCYPLSEGKIVTKLRR